MLATNLRPRTPAPAVVINEQMTRPKGTQGTGTAVLVENVEELIQMQKEKDKLKEKNEDQGSDHPHESGHDHGPGHESHGEHQEHGEHHEHSHGDHSDHGHGHPHHNADHFSTLAASKEPLPEAPKNSLVR